MKENSIVEKQETIRTYLKANLSPFRFKHSEGVEASSIQIARKFLLNTNDCSLAGLSHDICREIPDDKLMEVTGRIHVNPVLLHGEAGALKLQKEFSIHNNTVLDAVRFHISGRKGLDDVGKAVFAADFLEEGRSHLNCEERSRLFLLDLDDMVLEIALRIKRYLLGRGSVIDPDLEEMIEDLS